MPIYEYHCPDCGADFDHLWRRMPTDDDPAPDCPNCGATNAVRKLSVFAMGQGSAPAAGPNCEVRDMGGCAPGG